VINEILWVVSIIFFCIVEASTAGLVSIWFAGGALAALISSMLGANVYLQILIFLIVSGGLLVAMRKVALKSFRIGKEKTNTDRFIGQEIIITETVDNKSQTGKAKINDVEWKVKSDTGEIIQNGETVRICRIEGVKLVVNK